MRSSARAGLSTCASRVTTRFKATPEDDPESRSPWSSDALQDPTAQVAMSLPRPGQGGPTTEAAPEADSRAEKGTEL